MEKWQRSHIKENLCDLLENTRCTIHLIAALISEGLISKAEEDEINAKLGDSERTKLLYDILQTKVGAYPILTRALHQQRQSSALIILLNGFLKNGIVNPLTTCNIPVHVDKILAAPFMFHGTSRKLTEIFKDITVEELQEIMSSGQYEDDYIKHFLHGTKQVPELIFETIPTTPKYYIPRSISNRLTINPNLFKQDCKDVFVFKGIGRVELTLLAGRHGTSTCSAQTRNLTSRFIILDYQRHWDIIKSKSHIPVHLINVEGNTDIAPNQSQTFILEETFGHSEMIWQFVQTRDREHMAYISEDELISKINLPDASIGVCICDTPGMGKSLLLTKLAQQIQQAYPDRIVAFFPLTHFIPHAMKWFEEIELTKESALNTVVDRISQSTLTTAILQTAIARQLTVLELFLDGLDEVPDEHLNWTINFLKTLMENPKHIKLYVTSRPHLRRKLETTLGVAAYDILPFTLENQQDFLVQFWKEAIPEGDTSKLANFASACLKNVNETITGSERDILGIPLQCYMLAEVNRFEADIYSDPTQDSPIPNNLVSAVFDMYNLFFAQRFRSNKQTVETSFRPT